MEYTQEHLNRIKDEFARVLELRIKDCLENSEFASNKLSCLIPKAKNIGNIDALGVMITMVHRLKSVNSVDNYNELAELVWGNNPVIASNQLLKALFKYGAYRLSEVDISWVIEFCSPSYYLNHFGTKLHRLSSEKDNSTIYQRERADKATKVIEKFQAAHAELMELFN